MVLASKPVASVTPAPMRRREFDSARRLSSYVSADDELMGARPMARVIRVHIKKPLADEVLPPPCCTPMGHFPPGTLAALRKADPRRRNGTPAFPRKDHAPGRAVLKGPAPHKSGAAETGLDRTDELA